MKTTAIVVLLLGVGAVTTVYGGPRRQQKAQRPQDLQQELRPNAAPRPNAVRPAVRRSLLQNDIYAFYVKQFQQAGEVSPDVIPKILPFLDQYLDERFQIAERRTRALNQLRQAINRNGTDDEFKRFSRELDEADAEFLANHEKFLRNVDPLLTPRQQARVRMLQNQADNRLRQMLEALQNPSGPARRANAPATSDK
jgi:hypothetical protein